MNHSCDARRRRAWGRSALAGAAAVTGALAALWRRLERLEVVGESMLPTLTPGDRVLVLRGARAHPGDLVALSDPRDASRVVLKRLASGPGGAARLGDGAVLTAGVGCLVLGDNRGASADSRHFGPVALESIHGPVVYRYAPQERRGRIPAHALRPFRRTFWCSRASLSPYALVSPP